MPSLTVTVSNISTPAFGEQQAAERCELARILMTLAGEVQRNRNTSGSLVDRGGTSVGTWVLDSSKPVTA